MRYGTLIALVEAGHEETFHAFRFLFFRSKANRYHIARILPYRNLILVFVPVAVPADPAFQLFTILYIIPLVGGIQQLLQPWRSHVGNAGDASVNSCFLATWSIGTVGFDFDSRRIRFHPLGIAVTSALILVLIGGFVPRSVRPLHCMRCCNELCALCIGAKSAVSPEAGTPIEGA